LFRSFADAAEIKRLQQYRLRGNRAHQRAGSSHERCLPLQFPRPDIAAFCGFLQSLLFHVISVLMPHRPWRDGALPDQRLVFARRADRPARYGHLIRA